MKELTEAGIALAKAKTITETVRTLLDHCFIIGKPDLAAFYTFTGKGKDKKLKLVSFRGYKPEKETIPGGEESILFMIESKEAVCILKKKENPFKTILLTQLMESGIAVPLIKASKETGIIFLNYLHPYRFSFTQMEQIENLIKTALPRL